MLLHARFLAPLGKSFYAAYGGTVPVRSAGYDHCFSQAHAEAQPALSSLHRRGLSSPSCLRNDRGSFTVEASLLMIMILLVLVLLMGTARRSHEAIRNEASAFEAEAVQHQEERFIPRDLIRLCQFIEVWIPKKD